MIPKPSLQEPVKLTWIPDTERPADDWYRNEALCVIETEGQQCDGYPFSSTTEGGPGGASLKAIDGVENTTARSRPSGFYTVEFRPSRTVPSSSSPWFCRAGKVSAFRPWLSAGGSNAELAGPLETTGGRMGATRSSDCPGAQTGTPSRPCSWTPGSVRSCGAGRNTGLVVMARWWLPLGATHDSVARDSDFRRML
ncbi:NucA/NucB deoxyribonuclease domain-containing protein [Kineosporia sp. NBRC 101677]|uniref:NucA/NucB deoxyribonuclease domain-containing protein n=1 Tax=Kineosporia sp. NBRC 101677 TaxID=3032197 RepID=UPI003332221C